MGTRADHQITPQLSVRYDLYGGVADRIGPVSLTMERHDGDSDKPDMASFLLRSELTRDQAGELLALLHYAVELWADRVSGGDDGQA